MQYHSLRWARWVWPTGAGDLASGKSATPWESTSASKLEPLRGKLVRLVDRGWLRKLPDGRFTTRL
ncbi:hypothetical protein GCM10010360_16000 [Streptomyces nogalater]